MYRKDTEPWLATVLERVNLQFFRVFKIIFSKINFLVLTCVKVERSDIYSEGITPTSGFIKKWAVLGLKMASFTIRNKGAGFPFMRITNKKKKKKKVASV